MKILISILIALFTINAYSQGDKSAETLAKDAIKDMNHGKFEEAISKLEKALEISGGDAHYAYDLAHCHYQLRNFENAAFILDTLIRREDAQVHYFQMLGNCYDFLAKKDAAINIYMAGLNKFPDSGRLFMELATAEYGRSKYEDAEKYWKIALMKEPYYDNTYYRLTKYFHERGHLAAAIKYGELFLNTTFNETKFKEINNLLYKMYNQSLCNDCENEMEMISDEPIYMFELQPFYQHLYNMAYNKSFSTEKDSLNIADINLLRKNFRKEWLITQADENLNDPLFDYWNKISEVNMLDEYNYWLLSEGDPEEFIEWAKKNYLSFTDFINWKTENRIVLDEDQKASKED